MANKKYLIDTNTIIDYIGGILPNNAVESATIMLRKKHKIQLPDAIIAATAIVHELILITRNEKDFVKIPNIQIVNPHSL
jgi:predicted nucleic acid-binding protein